MARIGWRRKAPFGMAFPCTYPHCTACMEQSECALAFIGPHFIFSMSATCFTLHVSSGRLEPGP